jgi:hypothetical protein
MSSRIGFGLLVLATMLACAPSSGTSVTSSNDGGKTGSGYPAISALHIASEAQGDVLYFNGTQWSRLGAGTSGQFLQSLGTAANPTWANAASAGIWFSPVSGVEQDSSVTFSTVAGSFTCGAMFYILPNAGSGHTVSGVRFYWKGAATTNKVSLWTIASGGNTGTRVTSQTGAVTGTPGEFTINFTGAQSLSAGNYYAVSSWDTSGTSVTNFNAPSTNYSPYVSLYSVASSFHSYVGGRGTAANPFNAYGTGDTCCTNTSGTGMCAVEPVLQ